MGSVSSTNPALSNFLQTLSTESPQLSSILSTPNVQSALGSASPGDLVKLSDEAMQLQQVGLLFGDAANSTDTGSNSVFQALESAVAPAPTSATDPTASSPVNLQMQELDALFGETPPVNPLLNTLG